MLLSSLALTGAAHATTQTVTLDRDGVRLEGTLELPDSAAPAPVLLLLPDAGLTDRDGNGTDAESRDALKNLALALQAKGLASLRADKRGVRQGVYATLSELVADARAWLALLKRDARFNRVVVVGHGEGSLIGMALDGAAGFVSLNGLGRPAQIGLLETIDRTRPADAYVDSTIIVTELEEGRRVADMEPGLYRYFRPEVQGYLISLFALDPAAEFARVTVPALLVRGGADGRVAAVETEALARANPRAQRLSVPAMRHDLTDGSGAVSGVLLEGLLAFVGALR